MGRRAALGLGWVVGLGGLGTLALARADDPDPRQALRQKVVEAARRDRGKLGDLENKFRAADKDGDGVIARAEFPAPDPLFQRFDRDGDGGVTWTEAVEFAIEEEVAKAFDKYDADLSGTLTREELPEASRVGVDVADTDGDGALSGEESVAFWRDVMAEVAPTGPTGPPKPEAMTPDAQKPGPTPASFELPGVLGALGRDFSTRDHDHDGALDASELSGSRALLASLDADGDGRVRAAELELAQSKARDLAARGERLRQSARASGVEVELAVIGAEAKALFEAGRLDEVRAILDEVELRLLSRRRG
jgi:Ca2+-binding EF-hand superfamily protein